MYSGQPIALNRSNACFSLYSTKSSKAEIMHDVSAENRVRLLYSCLLQRILLTSEQLEHSLSSELPLWIYYELYKIRKSVLCFQYCFVTVKTVYAALLCWFVNFFSSHDTCFLMKKVLYELIILEYLKIIKFVPALGTVYLHLANQPFVRCFSHILFHKYFRIVFKHLKTTGLAKSNIIFSERFESLRSLGQSAECFLQPPHWGGCPSVIQSSLNPGPHTPAIFPVQ